ncbi:hypothetical protein [Zobellia alginiliquefaciens]|uniref:hypothetical protein n=1 Tax=Zobellia alginiliquefaciens TaxID=3032586 RepID=UPI0023E3DDDE|nr:hypothetical protein [Zobellia alginiliquefaciens]
MHASRTVKIILRIISVCLVLMAVIVLGCQLMAKKSIANYLDTKLPPHIQLDYKDIDVNVLMGTAKLHTIKLDIGKRDSVRHTAVQIEALEVVGLGYWHFLVNNKVQVENLNIETPKFTHYLKEQQTDTAQEDNDHIALLKTIQIGKIKVSNGAITLLKRDSDSTAMKLDSVHIEIEDVKTDVELINSKIPVTYASLNFTGESLYVDLGAYEVLSIAKVDVNEGNLSVSDLKLKSKYNKTELSWHLHKEHDYINLEIPKVHFKAIDFGYKNEKLWVRTGPAKLTGPNLEMYRDKLLPDDWVRKKLYSKALRELPIQIEVPEIAIEDGHIVYSERVNRKTEPGKIVFAKVDAKILNVQNLSDKKEDTQVKAKALLMNQAPITLNWSFDVQKESDAFTASGTVKNFNSKGLNSFLDSNLRVRAEGEVQELYFTISGDAKSSVGDMKMKYEDFEFSVLKKDRSGINKLLTTIGKIFVNDGSNTDESGYRYGGITAERDPTKSFFNYLWLNVSSGLTSTILGNGENERRKK